MTAKRKQGSLHSERFPGESAEYRNARDRLLETEIELRRRLEDVAKLRRQLPPGGALAQDFARRGGKIHHCYCTELLFAPSDPGQDGRHVDLIWPIWNLFDFTPEGRSTAWRPRLAYSS